jgi:hypothetical protein
MFGNLPPLLHPFLPKKMVAVAIFGGNTLCPLYDVVGEDALK